MNFKRIVSHLLQKPNIPPEMTAYCADELRKLNRTRMRYLYLLFIFVLFAILLVYGVAILQNGGEAVPPAYLIVDGVFLALLIAGYALNSLPYFRGKGFQGLLYGMCGATLAYSIALSFFDNNATCFVMASMVLPVGMLIKPRAFVVMQLCTLLPVLLVVSYLQTDFFSQLSNLINILLCVLVSAYICRITYNMVTENIANTRAIEQKNAELKDLSETDTLTSLLNRRKLAAVMDHEWNRAARAGSSLAVIILDIDYFKDYNDAYGHLAGDACLALIGKTLREKFMRAGEYAARYGGEEFALVLAGYDEDLATRACERLIASVAALAIPHKTSSVAEVVTLSAGICAAVPAPADHPADFIAKADAALYEAKAAGRNRYVVAEKYRSLSDLIGVLDDCGDVDLNEVTKVKGG